MRSISPSFACLGRCPASKAAANHRDGLRTDLMQVANRRQNVEVNVIRRVDLRSALRLAAPTEIDGKSAESGLRQSLRLRRPTLLVEPTPVRQHDAAIAVSVHVGMNNSTVLGRERHVLGPAASNQHYSSQGQSNDSNHLSRGNSFAQRFRVPNGCALICGPDTGAR